MRLNSLSVYRDVSYEHLSVIRLTLLKGDVNNICDPVEGWDILGGK